MVNDIKFEHNPKAQKGTVGEVLGADKVALCGAVVVWVVVAGEQVFLATLVILGDAQREASRKFEAIHYQSGWMPKKPDVPRRFILSTGIA